MLYLPWKGVPEGGGMILRALSLNQIAPTSIKPRINRAYICNEGRNFFRKFQMAFEKSRVSKNNRLI